MRQYRICLCYSVDDLFVRCSLICTPAYVCSQALGPSRTPQSYTTSVRCLIKQRTCFSHFLLRLLAVCVYMSGGSCGSHLQYRHYDTILPKDNPVADIFTLDCGVVCGAPLAR